MCTLKVFTDFGTKKSIELSKVDGKMFIKTDFYQESFPVPVDNLETMSFDDVFREKKMFCHENTIANMKMRIIRFRRKWVLSKTQARFAFHLAALINTKNFSDKFDYMNNGHKKIPQMLIELRRNYDELSAKDITVIDDVLSVPTIAFKYNAELNSIKKNVWDNIYNYILGLRAAANDDKNESLLLAV